MMAKRLQKYRRNTLKTCTGCQQTKSLDDFHRDRHGRDGHTSQCRACKNQKSVEWRAANPEKNRAAIKRWAQTDKGREQAKYSTEKYRKRKYGLTTEQYEMMMGDQSGRCAICQNKTDLYVDHCHETKRIRGLLCHHCNTLLGMAKDDTNTLLAAIAYLRKEAMCTSSR